MNKKKKYKYIHIVNYTNARVWHDIMYIHYNIIVYHDVDGTKKYVYTISAVVFIQ